MNERTRIESAATRVLDVRGIISRNSGMTAHEASNDVATQVFIRNLFPPKQLRGSTVNCRNVRRCSVMEHETHGNPGTCPQTLRLMPETAVCTGMKHSRTILTHRHSVSVEPA